MAHPNLGNFRLKLGTRTLPIHTSHKLFDTFQRPRLTRLPIHVKKKRQLNPILGIILGR